MTRLMLSSLRCDSVAVSDDLNPDFTHALLPFPALCSHLFSCAGTFLRVTQGIANEAALGCAGEDTIKNWVGFGIECLRQKGSDKQR